MGKTYSSVYCKIQKRWEIVTTHQLVEIIKKAIPKGARIEVHIRQSEPFRLYELKLMKSWMSLKEL